MITEPYASVAKVNPGIRFPDSYDISRGHGVDCRCGREICKKARHAVLSFSSCTICSKPLSGRADTFGERDEEMCAGCYGLYVDELSRISSYDYYFQRMRSFEAELAKIAHDGRDPEEREKVRGLKIRASDFRNLAHTCKHDAIDAVRRILELPR